MLTAKQLNKVLFIDIETVRQQLTWEQLPETTQKLWERKAKYLVGEDTSEQKYLNNAGIFAEFGKIICVSIGFLYEKDKQRCFKLKSFYGDDERKILQDFKKLLDEKFNDWFLCAHNGKEFDYPYLCRRFLVNQINLPQVFDIQGKKPWEVTHLDTLELWKFGDKKAFTSLELLCHIFNIPTPKDDISGADVGRVYWEEQGIEKIAHYCEKDVLATAQLLLKFNLLPVIENQNIFRTE